MRADPISWARADRSFCCVIRLIYQIDVDDAMPWIINQPVSDLRGWDGAGEQRATIICAVLVVCSDVSWVGERDGLHWLSSVRFVVMVRVVMVWLRLHWDMGVVDLWSPLRTRLCIALTGILPPQTYRLFQSDLCPVAS